MQQRIRAQALVKSRTDQPKRKEQVDQKIVERESCDRRQRLRELAVVYNYEDRDVEVPTVVEAVGATI